jgi:hypothetical protein
MAVVNRGMPGSPIPRHIDQFIASHIDSVGELEALLLLRASGAPLEAAQIAQRLYTGETETIEMLNRLCRGGLLVCSGKVYKYECRTEELARMVDELAELYRHQLIPITNRIHAKSRRIRQFADAFRFKKDR